MMDDGNACNEHKSLCYGQAMKMRVLLVRVEFSRGPNAKWNAKKARHFSPKLGSLLLTLAASSIY